MESGAVQQRRAASVLPRPVAGHLDGRVDAYADLRGAPRGQYGSALPLGGIINETHALLEAHGSIRRESPAAPSGRIGRKDDGPEGDSWHGGVYGAALTAGAVAVEARHRHRQHRVVKHSGPTPVAFGGISGHAHVAHDCAGLLAQQQPAASPLSMVER